MENTSLHQSCHDKLDATLGKLVTIWNDIGLSKEQREERRKHFFLNISNVCENIYDSEKELKQKITRRIEYNTFEIVRLSRELGVDTYYPDEDLTALEMDEKLQSVLDDLRTKKEERMAEVAALHEKDQGLCEYLCETPHYIPSGCLPSVEDLQAVKDHILLMEKEKNDRQATFIVLKKGIMGFLETLEQSPDDTLCKEIACYDEDEVSLSKSYLQQVKSLHSELEFRAHEMEMKSLELREKIESLWTLLQVSQEDKEAFLASAPKHTPSCINKLEEELTRLKCLRVQNLSSFILRLREELAKLWEQCYAGEAEMKAFAHFNSDESTEAILEEHEAEVEKWETRYKRDKDVLLSVDKFMRLFKELLDLEERVKDPGRLFNTRGGVLLQEEKERKRIRTELPRVQEILFKKAEEWELEHGEPFMVHGQPLVRFVEDVWDDHQNKQDEEKMKRQQAKVAMMGTSGRTGPSQSQTPGAKKRGRDEDKEQVQSKRAKALSMFRSPVKQASKVIKSQPWSCPSPRPLGPHNSTSRRNTLRTRNQGKNTENRCSGLSYERFADRLRKTGENVNSTTLSADGKSLHTKPTSLTH
ncbi:protein regulator of cytokinesis 1-like isoform X2 [Oratosquilla oratoria]|uniref:protein regulator of cytokinesis 1-like isoform X2 n=1 Tax=Oratosquilla oratoria TaxID=337810 RepID=UPI003F772C02